jgi:hypothetical protein
MTVSGGGSSSSSKQQFVSVRNVGAVALIGLQVGGLNVSLGSSSSSSSILR